MKQPKNINVTFRITAEDHQRIKDIATSKNVTTSSLIRTQILRLK